MIIKEILGRIRHTILHFAIYPVYRRVHRFIVYDQNLWIMDLSEHVVRFAARSGLDGLFVVRWSRLLSHFGLRERQIEFLQWASNKFDNPEYNIELLMGREAIGANVSEDIRELTNRSSALAINYDTYINLLRLELSIFAEKQNLNIFGFGQEKKHSHDLAARAYRQMWLAHQASNNAKVIYYAKSYARLTGYDLPSIKLIITNIAIPAGLHQLAIDLLEQTQLWISRNRNSVASRRSNKPPEKPQVREHYQMQIAEIQTIRNQALYELGKPLNQSVSRANSTPMGFNAKGHYWAALFAKQNANEATFTAQMYLYIKYASDKEYEYLHLVHFHLACHYESLMELELAEFHYTQMLLTEGIPYYLPNTTWRYVSFLMATDRWAEAAVILGKGGAVLWQNYQHLTRKPFIKRLKSGNLIPEGQVIILGCQGLGDEIIRLGILSKYRKLDRDLAITIDPRMQLLLARSFPELKLIPISRQNGKIGVSPAQYWKDREGIPVNSDLARITSDVMRERQKRKNLIISEDVFLHYVTKLGKFPVTGSEPMLKVDDDFLRSAKAWIDSLPGTLKVGISWRSGFRDQIRSESYVDVLDLGPIWKLPNVTYFSLQYSDTSEEEAEIEDKYGVTLHKMPNVDRRDDIDELAALSYAADVVIAPGTAARELAGAVGANTLSLTTTPVLPDLWRTEEDKEIDTIFPSIRHLTTYHYKNKKGVIEELARRLKVMANEKNGKKTKSK